MIKKLFEEGYLNAYKILLKEQIRLNITPEELVVLSALLSLYERKRTTVSINVLAKLTTLSPSKTGEVFNHLIENGYIGTELELKNDGKEKEVFSLDLLFDKMAMLFNADILQSSHSKKDQDIASVISGIEKSFNKALSPYDLEIVKEWFVESFTKEQIDKSIIICLEHHRKTVSYIDRVLRSMDTFESNLDDQKRDTIHKLIRGVK